MLVPNIYHNMCVARNGAYICIGIINIFYFGVEMAGCGQTACVLGVGLYDLYSKQPAY